MEPKTRFARVLPEIAPTTAGQVGGRIRITSERPIVAAELFGDVGLQSLSAVPAEAIAHQEPLSLDGEWAVVADGGVRYDPEQRVHLLRKSPDSRLVHAWSSEGLGNLSSSSRTGRVVVADFDGDGFQEIVYLSSDYEISLFKTGSEGEPSFQQTLNGTFPRLWNLEVGDVDNDGDGRDEIGKIRNNSRGGLIGMTVYSARQGLLERSFTAPYGDTHVQYNIGN